MSANVYVNELAFRDAAASDEEAEALFDGLVRVLRSVSARLPSFAVVSREALAALSIGPTWTAARWLGSDRDRQRRLKAFLNRSPFDEDLSAIEEEVRGMIEHFVEGEKVDGLGLASFTEGLGVSLDRAPWQRPVVDLQRLVVYEDDDGEMREDRRDVACRHATESEHLGLHDDWVKACVDAIQRRPTTPDELWRRREHWYPNLRFLDRVGKQIGALHAGTPTFHAICVRLEELQQSAGAWKPGQQASPEWRTKVTGEGMQRSQLCVFKDIDGEEYTFDLHARFTPGAGRIHFRLDPSIGGLAVAHVGLKIGA